MKWESGNISLDSWRLKEYLSLFLINIPKTKYP